MCPLSFFNWLGPLTWEIFLMAFIHHDYIYFFSLMRTPVIIIECYAQNLLKENKNKLINSRINQNQNAKSSQWILRQNIWLKMEWEDR